MLLLEHSFDDVAIQLTLFSISVGIVAFLAVFLRHHLSSSQGHFVVHLGHFYNIRANLISYTLCIID